MRSLLMMVLLLVSPTIAIAQESAPLPEIIEQQEQLRTDLAEGIEGLTPRQKRIIAEAQAEFFEAAAGKQALDDLSITEKVRVQNALATINAQLVNTRASLSDQEVCWRETKTGSKTKVTRCGTKEEREQVRRDSQSALEKARICSGPGCG